MEGFIEMWDPEKLQTVSCVNHIQCTDPIGASNQT